MSQEIQQKERRTETVEKLLHSETVSYCLSSSLKHKPENFRAGQISQCYGKWTKLTRYTRLVNIVKYGYGIEFVTQPCQKCNRNKISFIEKENY